MAARCMECEKLVTNKAVWGDYDDERELALCSECDGYLCEDCSVRLGGICSACKREMEEP